jgi:hypothetical protein
MPTADSNRAQVFAMEEVTWGDIPATALDTLRFTGESLKFAIETITSNEIRYDRQVSDLVQVGAEANGGINWELSYGAVDLLLEGALFSDWEAEKTITDTTISAANADSSFNDSGSGFPSFSVGQWIKVSGFTGDPSNNGFFKVVTATAAKITVDGTLVDDAAGESVTIKGTMIRNGITKKSYVVEKQFADITQFISYTGMVVADMSLEVNAGAILTGVFNFMGKSGVRAGTTVGTGGPNAAPTNDVMNAVSNVLQVEEGGAASAAKLSKLNLSLNNNLRALPQIGVLGAGAIGAGRIDVSGGLSAYFEDGVIYDKFVAATASSLSWRMQDVAGNAYILTLPKIKWTDADVVAGGLNQDVMTEMGLQAILDPTTGCSIQFDKFAA